MRFAMLRALLFLGVALPLCTLVAQAPPARTASAAATAARDSLRAEQSARALEQARDLLAEGDSAGATNMLRTATARDPENGPLWFAYGMLLSERTKYAWRRGVMPAGVPNMIIAAESSLARASRLSPDSVQYAIEYGRHLFGVNVTSITRATTVQQAALEKAAEGDDIERAAFLADDIGIKLWRRFEALIGRVVTWDLAGTFPMRWTPRSMDDWLRVNTPLPKRMFGQHLYNEAAEYFRYARMNDKNSELYFRHEMMLMAEGNRWMEMGAVSRDRIRERPRHAWPWLTLGLSEHRLGRTSAAQALFDSGFARLPLPDRQRLTSLAEMLPRKQHQWYMKLTTSEHRDFVDTYWNDANPLMLLGTNPVFEEFRARAVYAELRFTSDEHRVKGASSTKGIIYTRYGPPDRIVDMNEVKVWFYVDHALMFPIQENRFYGVGYVSENLLSAVQDVLPVSFNNVPVVRNRLDSVSTQVTRFRATVDSMDIAVHAGIRLGKLRHKAPTTSSNVRHGVFVLDRRGNAMARLQQSLTSSENDTSKLHATSYVVRAENTARLLRVEALEPELMRGARAVRNVAGFATSGFGVSDLLLAASVTPPANSDAARWRDFAVTPLEGNALKRGAPLSLIWESYEAAGDSSSGKLRFTVNVERETSSGLVAIGTRVIGGIREVVGRPRASRDIAITYDREFTARPALVDYLTIDLGNLSPGDYRITVSATNLHSGEVRSSARSFQIVR